MQEAKVQIVPVGGRVKGAALGLNFISESKDPIEVEKSVGDLRKNPPPELLKAFFPRIQEIRQMVRGVGLYRPLLKTDQGMPGNFMPFFVNEEPDFDRAEIIGEEGIAIPEAHAPIEPQTVERIQSYFHDFRLREVFQILQQYSDHERRAEKGRGTFFFIRGAVTDKALTFGAETVAKVESEVNAMLRCISEKAQELEAEHKKRMGITRPYEGDRLLYCQPDVFILSDGQVVIEKINCPDVGLFLTKIEGGARSSVFAKVREINSQMGNAVIQKICEVLKASTIGIVTRDEVLESDEDVLEMNEIEMLKELLLRQGISSDIYGARAHLPGGTPLLLLNIDYGHPESRALLERHCRGDLNCYPNPFFQIAAAQSTSIRTVELNGKPLEKFLELSGANPKNDHARRDIHRRIERFLGDDPSDIIHTDIGFEIVPVMRSSLHSFRQIGNRIQKSGKKVEKILLRHLPANGSNLKITSDTGPRLHTYRFMAVKQ